MLKEYRGIKAIEIAKSGVQGILYFTEDNKFWEKCTVEDAENYINSSSYSDLNLVFLFET